MWLPDRLHRDEPCVVAAGTRFEGLLSFEGMARIEGDLFGEIAGEGTLEVGPQAYVEAEVDVDTLSVEGALLGRVRARRQINVRAGARVAASIETARLIVASGARVDGRVAMRPGAAPSSGFNQQSPQL